MVREFGEDDQAQIAMQGDLLLLPDPHHGRRQEHDSTFPHALAFQG